jgi:hypothetical protein
MKSLEIVKFGIFGEPRAIAWSASHDKFIVMCRQTIATYDEGTGEQKVVYASDTKEFMGMAVSTLGYTSIMTRGLSSMEGSVKVLAPNFFAVAHDLNVGQMTMRGTTFMTGDIAVVAYDNDSSGDKVSTTFSILPPNGTATSFESETNGHVVSIIHDNPSGGTVAVTSAGEIWSIQSLGSAQLIGDLQVGVSMASGGMETATKTSEPQGKVRIFVGSRAWANDMWDSGEIETSQSTMPYGGGDNLEPGHRYWVHIMTWHTDSRWSKPQIRSFVMPRQ